MSGRAPTPADIATLLAPIDGGAGQDVGSSGDYERIAEARRDENASLPRGIWVRDIKQADWGLAERLCTEVLAKRSKDLRVACWLCEAWVHLYGFAGLGGGLALLLGLCRDFWTDLHPALEGEDRSARVAAFEWLNERLPAALRVVPVLFDTVQPDQAYNWADLLAAKRLDAVRLQDPAAAQKAEASGAVTEAMIEERRERTDSAVLARIAADLGEALATLATLDQTLDGLCGRDPIGFSKIRAVGTAIADFATATLAARKSAEAPAEAPAEAAAIAAPPPAAAMSRASAYRQLAGISEFLRATEPHSPVPDVLDQIISWGELSIIELETAMQEAGSSVSILLQSIGFQGSQRGRRPSR
jgi:type VI secretion system ImpA family protein